MGVVNLKVTLGTVNYVNWLHVTASKVSSPAIVVWERWIDVPVTNFNFVITNLDPENYYVRYYDSPTDSSLGTLVLELLVNALTGETILERRFYTVDGAGPNDPADGTASITDPYLIDKTITGSFKEGFRYFDPETETFFDNHVGRLDVINGTTFSTGEKFIIEIKYNIASTGGPIPGGLYNGTLDVPEMTRTLLAADVDKRIRCVGVNTTQAITVCALSSIAMDRGFYFDNACCGTANQVKILLPGTDRIKFSGFMAASDSFAEFWVSKGEHLLIRKFDDSTWEVITDYKGVEVGNRQAAGYVGMPGWHAEDGSLSDGDEYCRVWWWLNTILPANHQFVDDTVTDIGYIHPADKVGQFVKHSTLKKFRWPNTQGISEKGLADFNTYGGDTVNRPIDYPGGFQEEMFRSHSHEEMVYTAVNNGGRKPVGFDLVVGGSLAGSGVNTGATGGPQNRVDNIGVIYARHI